jgi:hypothetical protein
VTVTTKNAIEPVYGGLVIFAPPASGASATLTSSPAPIVGTGTASLSATANGSAGSYIVSATATGIQTPAQFNLTNTTPRGADILSAGFTVYDTTASANEAVLMPIPVERQSADSCRSPVAANNRGAGGVLNGGNELDRQTLVLCKIDKLTAEPAWAAVDGFFADAALEHTTIKDFETREHLNDA